MKVVSGHGIRPVTNARVVPSFAVCVLFATHRAPEEEGADDRNQRTTCDLELRRAATISECPTDDGETQD